MSIPLFNHKTLAAYFFVWSWWVCGLLAMMAGFFGVFADWLQLLLLLPLVALTLSVLQLWRAQEGWQSLERLLLCLALGVWLLHLVQVFVPETGFDALWYHLPVAQLVTQHQQFVYVPELYQTANPLFSDSIFFLGYLWQKELGAKVVAYGFGLSLVVMTYLLARIKLSRTWALASVLTVSAFQVVSWQSSSFYIDIAKAVWELGTLFVLLQAATWQPVTSKTNNWWQRLSLWQLGTLSGLLFGASVASKVFSVMLVPGFVIAILVSLQNLTVKQRLEMAVFFVTAVFLLALPFYWFAFVTTGSFLGLASTHVDTLMLSSVQSVPEYLLERFLALPKLPILLVFNREYLSVLFVLFLPLAALWVRDLWKDSVLRLMSGFVLMQLAVWWVIPPLSVRYALSGFVMLAVLVVWMIWQTARKLKLSERKVLAGVVFVALVILAPRVMVVKRSLPYLTGQQTKQDYVEQFLDGNVDRVLREWYRL